MADLPTEFKGNVDWVKQPPPAQAHETHTLHFWLQSPDGLIYQGFMFYHAGRTPKSPITQEQNGIEGKGYLIPNAPVCERWGTPTYPPPWVRVRVTFRTAEEHGGNADVHATLLFHNSAASHSLPGDVVGAEEFDRIDASIGGNVLMFPGQGSGWILTLTKTTVSL